MSNIKFSVDVENGSVGRKIRRRIEDGIDNAASEINDEMRSVAKGKIKTENAVFRGELLAGFVNSKVTFGDSTVASLRNLSDHAAYQDRGVSGTQRSRKTPYKYRNKKPPIASLIPWVEQNLTGAFWPDNLDRSGAGDLNSETRDLAFWLQDKIFREGIEGIHFMKDARLWAEKNAADVTAKNISKELRKL